MRDGSSQQDVLSWVRSLIWSGECGEDEVALRIEDQLGKSDEVDDRWLREAIKTEADAKRKTELTWPPVTDFDRLDRAFTILEALGIIALHRVGFTVSDGFEEVEDAYEEAGGRSSEYSGFCFYTEQDQELALSEGILYIAFGHLSGNDKKNVKVGQNLRSTLEQDGFAVEWDGTVKSRLVVKPFRWQRRSPW